MKITRRQIRKLIREYTGNEPTNNEGIDDLDWSDKGKVAIALSSLAPDHRKVVENFLNNTLNITAEEFNKIEADDELIGDIEDAVGVYRDDNDIGSLIDQMKVLLSEYIN